MQSRKNNRVNRSNRSRRNSRRSVRNSRRPTFAAQLGAFILQGLSPNTTVTWSVENGFSNKQTQVSGVLPFLHLNIKEHQFRDLLRNSHNNHVKTLEDLCNGEKLNEVLHKVNFNCNRQSNNGVSGLEDAIVDSIKNSWNMRANGRKHLATVERHMRKQVELKIIRPSSVVWAN